MVSKPEVPCKSRNITAVISSGSDRADVEISPGHVLSLSAGQHVYEDDNKECIIYISCVHAGLQLRYSNIMRLHMYDMQMYMLIMMQPNKIYTFSNSKSHSFIPLLKSFMQSSSTLLNRYDFVNVQRTKV